MLLNYSNASLTLPRVIAQPDLDFLLIMLVIVITLCLMAFMTGYAMALLSEAKPDERVSLVFGLGMNNNGTGLVLASVALADHPEVILPVILYTLVQHLLAAAVDSIFLQRRYRGVGCLKGMAVFGLHPCKYHLGLLSPPHQKVIHLRPTKTNIKEASEVHMSSPIHPGFRHLRLLSTALTALGFAAPSIAIEHRGSPQITEATGFWTQAVAEGNLSAMDQDLSRFACGLRGKAVSIMPTR